MTENEFETVASGAVTKRAERTEYYDRLAQAIADLPDDKWIRLPLEGRTHLQVRESVYQAMRVRNVAVSTTELDEESLGVRARKDVRA